MQLHIPRGMKAEVIFALQSYAFMNNMWNVTLVCYYEDCHHDFVVFGEVYIVFLLHLISYEESCELRGYVIMLLDNYFTC